jgi:hypothetical protein
VGRVVKSDDAMKNANANATGADGSTSITIITTIREDKPCAILS